MIPENLLGHYKDIMNHKIRSYCRSAPKTLNCVTALKKKSLRLRLRENVYTCSQIVAS